MKPWASIFSIVPACHADVGHYTTLWNIHFYEGLRDVVTTVGTPKDIWFDWAFNESTPRLQLKAERSDAAQRLHEQISTHREQHGLDAVLSYGRSREIDPELIREIVRFGTPWIHFFCDSIGDFASVQEIAEVASLNWFPESNAVSSYRAFGRPILQRPYAYNPRHLPQLPNQKKIHGLGFVGMPTSNRVSTLGALSMLGCPCAIRGYGWREDSGPKTHPRIQRRLTIQIAVKSLFRRIALRRLSPHIGKPLKESEFFEFLAECRIVLGLNDARNSQGSLESYLKFRDLEMPGYGCCYLTQDNIDIRNSLTPEREVLLFGNIWEARDKARFYAKRQDLTERIAQAGRNRVLKEHTWAIRIHEIQRAVEGKSE